MYFRLLACVFLAGFLPDLALATDNPSSPLQRSYFYVGGHYTGEPGKEIMKGQMYVEALFPPKITHPHPIVLIHGAAQTATNWMGTPDGRPGWSEYFVSKGYVVYMIDQPARGRSAWHQGEDGNLRSFPASAAERFFTATAQFGLWPQARKHTQWPGTGRMGDRVFEVRKFPVPLPGGQIGVGGYVYDVTDRLAAENARTERDTLHWLAHTDPLTNLPNRRGMQEALSNALRLCCHEQQLAVYLLDLDGFKPVNDEHGHDVGDELLVAVARRLQGHVRATDLVARLGGDEFVVVASALESPAQAHDLANKLLDAFHAPFTLSSTKVQVGLTIGYALAPLDAYDAASLLKLADAAMYQGKQNGKFRVQRSTEQLAMP